MKIYETKLFFLTTLDPNNLLRDKQKIENALSELNY